jgi:hypothetical protein
MAGGATPHQNIQYLGAGGMYDTATTYGGGGVPIARSELDHMRMGVGREPSAEYPDGYLGTIRSRRDDRGRASGASDRALDSMKTRLGQKSYQRGVHRGERIDPSDYYYPSALTPDRGIKRQMRAVQVGNTYVTQRYVENMMLVPAPHLQNDGKANMRSTSPGEIDQKRVGQLKRLTPAWR